jgi:hypothetical protein
MENLVLSDTLRIIDVSPHLPLTEYLNQPTSILALLAIVLSAASLLFSVIWNRRTFNLTKKHNVLSVKPLLTVHTQLLDDNKFLISLTNEGLGPAYIREVTFLYNNKTYNSFNDIYIIKKQESRINVDGIFGTFIASSLGKGARFIIFMSKANQEIGLHDYRVFFDHIGIRIIYNDIYENQSLFEDKFNLISSKEE